MAETLSVTEMIPNKFEPKRKNRWIFAIEGIDAFLIKSGHLVCNIDSKSSHSSVEGNVLIKIFVYMIVRLTEE